jgi:hypothetical protein
MKTIPKKNNIPKNETYAPKVASLFQIKYPVG